MFAKLVFRARRIERRRLALLKEKQDAFRGDQALTFGQRCTHFYIRLTNRLKKAFRFPKHSLPYRLCLNIRHEGTCENFTAKSVAGFLGGFFLTYIFFMFFVLQLNFKLSTATIMCSFFGSILTIGLAYSFTVRCIVFLVLPQFFSKKGRQALLAYAFILAITGPAKNTLNNMSILGESMACGQEQLKAAVKQILEVIKKPFYAIRDAVKQVVATVKSIVAKIKDILLAIKRIILSLVKIVKSASQFVGNIMNFCNKEIGTPFQRCQKVFEEAVVDCNAKLGPMFNWLCNIPYFVRHVCYIVKPFDFFCVVVDFVKDIVSSISTKVRQFLRHIRTLFYVRIKFSHSYHFESNHTKSMEEITTGIVTEIKKRSSGLIKIFDFMSSAASLFFIFMICKVVYYRQKFLTNEMFDNKFITNDFRQIDLRRAQMGLETVLPLNHRERKLYISTSSLRLVDKEKSRLSEAAMILLMSTLKLSTHMATDYSLYWIMTLIRHYGRFQSNISPPNIPGVHIEGEGFLSTLLKGIVKAFHPIGLNLEIDTMPCLPDPIPPDFDRYIQIASLLILCWFLAMFEPYGLRFRHSVMCFYHPHRARERAIWLYNHILRSRSSFLKFARRQLRRRVMLDKSISKVTCWEYFLAKIADKYPTIILIFGAKAQLHCLLCGETKREGDGKVFVQCETPNCTGLYCEQCYSDLQNVCTVCLDPISYGDLSDISEERDSSVSETERDGGKSLTAIKKRKKKKRKCWQKKHSSDSSDEDDDVEKKLIPVTMGSETDFERDLFDTSNLNSESDMGWSSDYSFDYQSHKNISEKSEVVKSIKFKDMEKQDIAPRASMADFHEDRVLEYLRGIIDEHDNQETLEFSRSTRYFRNVNDSNKENINTNNTTSGNEISMVNFALKPIELNRYSSETSFITLIQESPTYNKMTEQPSNSTFKHLPTPSKTSTEPYQEPDSDHLGLDRNMTVSAMLFDNKSNPFLPRSSSAGNSSKTATATTSNSRLWDASVKFNVENEQGIPQSDLGSSSTLISMLSQVSTSDLQTSQVSTESYDTSNMVEIEDSSACYGESSDYDRTDYRDRIRGYYKRARNLSDRSPTMKVHFK